MSQLSETNRKSKQQIEHGFKGILTTPPKTLIVGGGSFGAGVVRIPLMDLLKIHVSLLATFGFNCPTTAPTGFPDRLSLLPLPPSICNEDWKNPMSLPTDLQKSSHKITEGKWVEHFEQDGGYFPAHHIC